MKQYILLFRKKRSNRVSIIKLRYRIKNRFKINTSQPHKSPDIIYVKIFMLKIRLMLTQTFAGAVNFRVILSETVKNKNSITVLVISIALLLPVLDHSNNAFILFNILKIETHLTLIVMTIAQKINKWLVSVSYGTSLCT